MSFSLLNTLASRTTHLLEQSYEFLLAQEARSNLLQTSIFTSVLEGIWQLILTNMLFFVEMT